ncbi:unnamed protein product [Amaranthus hypochondriacus]
MRGGRGSRGRGGRGRGEELRDLSTITRSGSERSEIRAEQQNEAGPKSNQISTEEDSKNSEEQLNLNKEKQQACQYTDSEDFEPQLNQNEDASIVGNRSEANDKGVMEELELVKQKLEELQKHMCGSSINNITVEQAVVGDQVPEEDFPALSTSQALVWTKPATQLSSWKDKV